VEAHAGESYNEAVPSWDQAVVGEDKVLGYLLSDDHPSGRAKSAFFHSVGYARADWTRLRDDLLRIAEEGAGEGAVREEASSWGTKHVIDGVVEAPTGRPISLRTVWMVDAGDVVPGLVTAYPR